VDVPASWPECTRRPLGPEKLKHLLAEVRATSNEEALLLTEPVQTGPHDEHRRVINNEPVMEHSRHGLSDINGSPLGLEGAQNTAQLAGIPNVLGENLHSRGFRHRREMLQGHVVKVGIAEPN
jgi:hypothetical protein